MSNTRNKAAVLLLAVVVLAWGWKCPVWWVAGIPCPGCRFTRACIALAAGDLSYSLAQHAMVLPTLAAGCAWLLCKRRRTAILAVWAALMLAYWLWRMVFVFPDWPMNINEAALLPEILQKGIGI